MASDKRSIAAQLIAINNRARPAPADAEARFAELAAREARDTRNECQRLTGDPPPDRSALAQPRRKPAALKVTRP